MEDAQEQAEESRLPRAVRSQYGNETSSVYRGGNAIEDNPSLEGDGGLTNVDEGFDHERPDRAVSIASRVPSIHSWNVLPLGSVSLTPTTGTLCSRASCRICSVIFEVVWVL